MGSGECDLSLNFSHVRGSELTLPEIWDIYTLTELCTNLTLRIVFINTTHLNSHKVKCDRQ